jgi:glycosyltransferase involved in cell wall biosynthesis
MKMMLSIIIPHFNGSQLIEKLLASIPNDKNIQTIIVDDKSELFHLKAIELLKSKYDFEFYQNDKIKSSGLCRNIGIQKAKGKWIIFADSDDYFIDGFYNTLINYFDSKNDIIFFTPTSRYIDSGKFANRHLSFQKIIRNYLLDKSKKNELMLRYNFISPWSKMIKKEFLDIHNIRFDEGPIGAEDVMLSTQIGYFMKIFDVCDHAIYCRIVRYGSITRVFNEDQFNIRLHARVSRIKFLNKNLSHKELNIFMKPFIYNKASEFLLLSFRRFGFKKLIQVISLYKRENIKWFRLIYLNPFKIMKYVFFELINYIKNNKYNIR